jgi:hypothetical protein
MTISNGYATLAETRTFMRIDSTDAADDTVIESLIENASRLFDGETGRRFYTTASDETRTYTAEFSDVVFTDEIISITTLKTDDDEDRVYENTWAVTDYDMLPENATLNGFPVMYIVPSPNSEYSGFPTNRKGVQIVGKFGWSATAPTDIKIAVMEITNSVYKKRFGENTTATATITGAGVVITPKDVPDTAYRTITHYRKLI